MAGNRTPPISSTGCRPAYSRRSSIVGCANREKLCTHSTRSSSYSRRNAITAGFVDWSSVYEPSPNAGFCLRISIMRRVQCSSEEGDDIDASTLVTW